jgi:hypothetical protein
MINQVSITGDALLAAICPYYPDYLKVRLILEDLRKTGTEVYYSPKDMEYILAHVDEQIKPCGVAIDTCPKQYSGCSPSQIQVARKTGSNLLKVYLDYTSFEAFRDAIEGAPGRLGLIESEALN